jgi:hypothetical protein
MIGAGGSSVLFLHNRPAHQERRITWEDDLAGDVESDCHQKDNPRYQQSKRQQVGQKKN